MPPRNGNPAPPQLTWANIVMTIGTAAVLSGAAWTLFQTQFGYIDKDKENIRWQLNQRTAEINSRFDSILSELRRIDDSHLSRNEFKMWQDERTKTVDRLIVDQDKVSTKVEQAVRDRASVESLTALQRQIDALREDIRRK